MTVVEQIENLQITFDSDDNFEKLKEALEEYHKLVDTGALVPRKNSISNCYSTFIAEMYLKHTNLE